MAIYHLNVRGISPARGGSAIAAAAYQSGERIRDERTGKDCRYSRAERVVDSGLVLPEGVDLSRAELWNLVEAAHEGGNALTARRVEVALPRELDREEQRACVLDLAATFKGRAVDWAVHDSGDGNPHAHLLVSAREVGPDGVKAVPKKSHKVYLCRDSEGNDVMVPAAEWKARKAEGLEKVFTFKDGRRLSMSQAAAEGLTKADRKTMTPVAVTRAEGVGLNAYDVERRELRRLRAAWADIANERIGEHAEREGTAPAFISHKSIADQRGQWERNVACSVPEVPGVPAGAVAEAARPAAIDHVPTLHEGPRPDPARVAENLRRRGINAAIDEAKAALVSLVQKAAEAAAGWWHRATDPVTRAREASIKRQLGVMRATAARGDVGTLDERHGHDSPARTLKGSLGNPSLSSQAARFTAASKADAAREWPTPPSHGHTR